MASETPARHGGEASPPDVDKSELGKRDRPNPPVGTDGPAADRKQTVPLDDLNSADDE